MGINLYDSSTYRYTYSVAKLDFHSTVDFFNRNISAGK